MNTDQGSCTQKCAFLLDVQMVRVNLDSIYCVFGTAFLGHFLGPYSSFPRKKNFPHN